MPASLSTSNATFSPGAMLATQIFSQDGGDGYFAVYEELVAASQVKYKPSDAQRPEPATNSLFSKMLAEEQSHSTLAMAQQAPKMAAAAAAAAAAQPQPAAQVNKTSAPARKSEPAATETIRSKASFAYASTVVRNKFELEEVPQIEPLVG